MERPHWVPFPFFPANEISAQQTADSKISWLQNSHILCVRFPPETNCTHSTSDMIVKNSDPSAMFMSTS